MLLVQRLEINTRFQNLKTWHKVGYFPNDNTKLNDMTNSIRRDCGHGHYRILEREKNGRWILEDPKWEGDIKFL